MSRSSSITDMIPVGPRSNAAAQKPRREESAAGFDRALNDADKDIRPEPRTQRSRDDRASQALQARDKLHRQDVRADRSEPVVHESDGDRRANRHHEDHGANNNARRPHDSEPLPAEKPARPQTGTVHNAAEESNEANVPGDPSDDAAAEKPALESPAGVVVIVAPVAKLPEASAELLATQLTLEGGQSASGESLAGSVAANVQNAAQAIGGQQLAPAVALQAAAAALAVEVKTANTATPDAAKATVGTVGDGIVSGASAAATPSAVQIVEAGPLGEALTSTEQAEGAQGINNAAAREFAKALDQAQAASSAAGGVSSAVSAPASSPVATSILEAAQQAKPATPADALARADAPVPLQAVAVEIGMRAMRGSKEFSIRLDPEDLGRIDVRLEISEAGQVQAKVVVERVETLQLLQRDAKTLERAFDQAGLKTSADGLQFSLRDPGQQGRDNHASDQRGNHGNRDSAGPEKANTDDITLRPAIYRMSRNSGLDIRI